MTRAEHRTKVLQEVYNYLDKAYKCTISHAEFEGLRPLIADAKEKAFDLIGKNDSGELN